jgi:peptide deformylase
MILKLAYYGNPILRKKVVHVDSIDDNLRQLVADMQETMHANNGIGLAAPQVCRSVAVFITCVPEYREDGSYVDGPLEVYINPRIISLSKQEELHSEGCLSIPKLYGDVSRPIAIEIEATNLEGTSFTKQLSGLEARCCLHENDHLNGVLFIDRIRGEERKRLEPDLRRIKNHYKNQ